MRRRHPPSLRGQYQRSQVLTLHDDVENDVLVLLIQVKGADGLVKVQLRSIVEEAVNQRRERVTNAYRIKWASRPRDLA